MPNDLLKTASPFDVHRWSDYPEVRRVTDAIFDEIKALRQSRKERIRGAEKVKKHLRVTLIDLWAAYKLSSNPYRGISKNKSDYQQEKSRYVQIHLTYDYLIKVINDLRDLGYLEEDIGFKDWVTGIGYRTRIKAADRLIDKILSPEYGVDTIVKTHGAIAIVQESESRETIILKDSNDKFVEYKDDDNTNLMRSKLASINNELTSARITLDITEEQAEELRKRLNDGQERDRIPVDFTNVKLHRVFNNSSWKQGGRFYGGWWQNLPKEYRKYIGINRGMTYEIDYSGHHYRILYAQEGLEPPDDPYDLDGFDREEQKIVGMIMLNSTGSNSALKAVKHRGLNPVLAFAFADRHEAIKRHFFSGAGLELQFIDSQIAENVMLRMLSNSKATVLPVHDSFIVRRGYQDELREEMKQEFESRFGKEAKIKFKETALEEASKGIEERETEFVTDNLEELLDINNSNWNRSIWGD